MTYTRYRSSGPARSDYREVLGPNSEKTQRTTKQENITLIRLREEELKFSMMGLGELGLPTALHAKTRSTDTGYVLLLIEFNNSLRSAVHVDRVCRTRLPKRREPTS